MLPAALIEHFRSRFEINAAAPIGGGCINDCYQLKTSEGFFFLKLNDATAYPGMFGAEAKGLKLLASANAICVPDVLEQGEVNSISYLLLEYIETGKAGQYTMAQFGEQLAELHRNGARQFGLDHNNFIGSLPQLNKQYDAWTDFFIDMRLQPQLALAEKKGLMSAELLRQFDTLFLKLDSLFPLERPALLHGDLWNGNYIIDKEGNAYIVDPAVYYGHREMDLAMSRLFGGFPIEFYDAYEHYYPLENNWNERVDLWNIYPVLVHVNLFGGSYLGQLKNCVEKFV